MNYSRKELVNFLKEEIQSMPCFYCIHGMLELVDVKICEIVQVDVQCQICKSKDQFELKL